MASRQAKEHATLTAPRSTHLASTKQCLHARTCVAAQYGCTALMYAAERGRVAVVRTLLKAGASLDLANNVRQTALDLATVPSVRELLASM